MQGVRKGNLLISQPRNPFAWSAVDPITRQKVVTVESGLGTMVPDSIWPAAPNSLGPQLAAMALGAMSSAVWLVANEAIYVPFTITVPQTVYKLWCVNGSAVSGNVDVAIYNAAFTRLISAGSTAQAGTNQIQIFDVADTELDTGRYYMALALSNTTGAFHRWQLSAFNSGARVLGMKTQAAAFPLPATGAPSAPATTTITVPMFGAAIRSDF